VVRNVIGVLPGSNATYAHQSVLISAHYDHLGFGWPDVHAGDQGRLHPGADDNASGVAVLLEVARALADSHPERSIIFAAFSGEEEGLRGSREFVRRAKTADDSWPLGSVIADLNLDTVGRLESGKLTVLGADSAREWPFIFSGITATTGIPITVVTKAVDASDHTAFIEAGVPAVQLFASTAVDYHRPGDTAAKIDVGGLVTVATALKEATDYLASRPDPLHYTGSAIAGSASALAPAPAPATPRRAATGIIPDMTYEGVGVRAAGIASGSGAEKAGLQAGDHLLSIAGTRTPDLKALAEALRDLHPGETVEVEFARDTHTQRAQLTLGER
jgi:Zn-dependent M28 family amino/carboxypeptidase